jgi:hypothetical protein
MIKLLSSEALKVILKKKSIKLDSLFALPWFLDYIARDLSQPRKFYVLGLNEQVLIPIISLQVKKVRLAYSPSPPNIITRDILGEDIENIFDEMDDALDYHVFIMRIHPHDKNRYLLSSMIKKQLFFEDRYDLYIDLKKKLSEIYYCFEKRTRYTLRKALGLDDNKLLEKFDEDPYFGGVVYEKNDENGVYYFSELLKYQFAKMVIENRWKNSKDLLGLYKYYSFENILRVYKILSEEKLLRFFFIEGRSSLPEAGVALFVSNAYLKSPMAYWWLGASTYYAEKNRLPTILQFSIMSILKKEGYERYFLGGVSRDYQRINRGPGLFKRGFGGEFKKGYIMIHVRGKFLDRGLHWLSFLGDPTRKIISYLERMI